MHRKGLKKNVGENWKSEEKLRPSRLNYHISLERLKRKNKALYLSFVLEMFHHLRFFLLSEFLSKRQHYTLL